jgi:thiopeptide-type bacteriocin biosynthesis protein
VGPAVPLIVKGDHVMNPATAVESPNSSKAEDLSRTQDLLYRPLDFVMVRAPLLPVQSYLDLADSVPDRQMSMAFDVNVHRALAVGSASLADALERFKRSGLTQRDTDRMRAKLLRYQIRMSTRPTPFGMFAGVALAQWGSHTDLHILSTCARTRTRPDMAWLMEFVTSTEAIPAVRRRLGFFTNPLAIIEAGRVFLSERAAGNREGQVMPVSVRASSVVKQALLLARTPICYEDLAARLSETNPSATPEKVEKLLNDLWEQTFLLTDLRPPLTTDSPARYVAERIAHIPEAANEQKKLDAFLSAAAAWDRVESEEVVESFRALLSQAGSPSDGSKGTPIQVDMAMSVEGRLGEAVAEESARAAELLLRLSPSPYGLSPLAAYRQAYVNRYGHDREVTLLELMDPSRGLGPMSNYSHAAVGPDAAKAAQRAQTLLRLACTALHDRKRVVDLDGKSLAQLETWRPNAETAPVSLDINLLVGARSAAAIDAGDFTIVIGPNLGAQAAGRNLARFSDMLTPDGPAALIKAAAAEQAHAPDTLMAEFVYLPSSLRSANVIIRPQIRSYEVAIGVSAGVPPSNIIPLDELVIGVEQGRFYVRWPAAGKRVIFSSGHMLNYHQAPAVGRFLMDLSADGKVMFTSFDWGPAESFPYLPRIQSGRIVLRSAQWLIRKNDLETDSPERFRSALNHWRMQWDVPQHVCIGFGDNRLILDLDQDAQASELSAELNKLPENNSIIVQEVLPALNESWLVGHRGNYYSEFIVSLVLRPNTQPADRPGLSDSDSARTSALSTVSEPVLVKTEPGTDTLSRRHAPGSEWLFVKLYCPRNFDDDVISDSMRVFAENAVASGLAGSWFFVRYSDPEAHLRLRFHGSPERLTAHLFPHICEWAGRLMSSGLCLKFMFDTYEQEIERFGGPHGMTAAEAVFSADSSSAAALVRCLKTKLWPYDETTLLALSIDDFMAGLGFDESERLRWYGIQTKSTKTDISAEYRQRKTALRLLLGQPDQVLANQPGGPEIASILATRRKAMSRTADSLRQLAGQGDLSQSLEVLASSFIHLHLNRMAGLDGVSEQRIFSLLLRARESLKNAPVPPSTPA